MPQGTPMPQPSNQGLRIDRSHDPLAYYLQPAAVFAGAGVVPLAAVTPSSMDQAVVGAIDSTELSRAHLEDVTLRLQQWAEDLDAREARLNARDALLDHRERTLRLQQAALKDEAARQAEQKGAQEKTLAEERERLHAALRGQWLGHLRPGS